MALPMPKSDEQIARMTPKGLRKYFALNARYLQHRGDGYYAIMFGTRMLRSDDTQDLWEQFERAALALRAELPEKPKKRAKT